jgi:hypothetical protein
LPSSSAAVSGSSSSASTANFVPGLGDRDRRQSSTPSEILFETYTASSGLRLAASAIILDGVAADAEEESPHSPRSQETGTSVLGSILGDYEFDKPMFTKRAGKSEEPTKLLPMATDLRLNTSRANQWKTPSTQAGPENNSKPLLFRSVNSSPPVTPTVTKAKSPLRPLIAPQKSLINFFTSRPRDCLFPLWNDEFVLWRSLTALSSNVLVRTEADRRYPVLSIDPRDTKLVCGAISISLTQWRVLIWYDEVSHT